MSKMRDLQSGQARLQVVEEIRRAVAEGRFDARVEVGEEPLGLPQREELLSSHEKKRSTWGYRANRRIARLAVNTATRVASHSIAVEGIEHVAGIRGGAIITSNHFSPTENACARLVAQAMGKKHLSIVTNVDNLGMSGVIGYLMRHADTVPLGTSPDYFKRTFLPRVKELTDAGECVLIYPEQEMWFNYRLPRPTKRGASLVAATCGVPVVPCFIEAQDRLSPEGALFQDVIYVMHVLEPIYPDPAKSIRQNSIELARLDYERKVEAYERAYHRPLDYAFSPAHIAGLNERAYWRATCAEAAHQVAQREIGRRAERTQAWAAGVSSIEEKVCGDGPASCSAELPEGTSSTGVVERTPLALEAEPAWRVPATALVACEAAAAGDPRGASAAAEYGRGGRRASWM